MFYTPYCDTHKNVISDRPANVPASKDVMVLLSMSLKPKQNNAATTEGENSPREENQHKTHWRGAEVKTS